jgi:hypothetical protein
MMTWPQANNQEPFQMMRDAAATTTTRWTAFGNLPFWSPLMMTIIKEEKEMRVT